MANRNRLPNRRAIVTQKFEQDGQRYVVSGAYFDDGQLAELFINSDGKQGSAADVNASDGAVIASLALQHGVPVERIRSALKRNADGSPQGPLGKALDLMAKIMEEENKNE